MENIRAIILMIVSMAGFAIEDALIKTLAQYMPSGQILLMIGVFGGLVFWFMSARAGHEFWHPAYRTKPIIGRCVAEMIGTIGYTLAVIFGPISAASAILQATPLVVTLGAGLFLKETIGWRRWSAVFVGFIGVMIVVRPGSDSFVPISLMAIIGVFGLGARDVITRKIPKTVPSLVVSGYGFLSLVPIGLGLAAIGDGFVIPDLWSCVLFAGVLGFGIVSYHMLTMAVRIGDLSVVMPFRFTRIIFALCIGILAFNETVGLSTLIGVALILAAGLYTFVRERKVKRAQP